MTLTKRTKTLDDKIKGEEIRYGHNKQTAKMFYHLVK